MSPRAQRVGRALADHAAYQKTPTSWRHLRRGDLAAWVSADTLAAEMGCSSRTVKRGIAELVDAGLLRRRTKRTNAYVFPSATSRRQPVTPVVTPCVTLPVTPYEPRTDEPRTETQREPAYNRPSDGGRWADDIPVTDPEKAARYGERARDMMERYRDLHVTHRGSPYVVSFKAERKDYDGAIRLCEAFPDNQLDKLMEFWLRIPTGVDDFVTARNTRTITMMICKASAIAVRLKLKGHKRVREGWREAV